MTIEHARLSSVVVYAHDLDRSIDFYSGLLGLESLLREEEGALLVGSCGTHLYLRRIELAVRASVGVGVQYTIWTFDSENEFGRALRWLEEHGGVTRRYHLEGMQGVEGRDPDNLSVIVGYPHWRQDQQKEIFSGIFNY
jgi:catechol 2,3-dioxygenase-like lactoylglutathione lyase family enzyme